jgi:hypothetical protein
MFFRGVGQPPTSQQITKVIWDISHQEWGLKKADLTIKTRDSGHSMP